MTPEGELGVDWGGDDDPGQSADVSPQETGDKEAEGGSSTRGQSVFQTDEQPHS